MASDPTGGIDDENLEDLYSWVDKIPLSRPKKNIARDFSDGLLIAEIINYFIPNLVELHNYPATNNTKSKTSNWVTLNRKVFKRLKFEVTEDVISQIVNLKLYAIELFLVTLRAKIDAYHYTQKQQTSTTVKPPRDKGPEADRGMYKQSQSPVRDYIDGRNADVQGHASPGRGMGGGNPRKGDSQNNLHRVGPGPTSYDYRKQPPGVGTGAGAAKGALRGGEMIPKIAVEEKEQEILAKEETIQILQAKIRRLEHLLHLKDIRIEDMQTQMNTMNQKLRPTNNIRR